MSLPSPSSKDQPDDADESVLTYASPAADDPPRPLTPRQERLMTVVYIVLFFTAIGTAIALMAWVSWSFHSQTGSP
jgi:hypothetical protein